MAVRTVWLPLRGQLCDELRPIVQFGSFRGIKWLATMPLLKMLQVRDKNWTAFTADFPAPGEILIIH
ncbi:hypothetical protein ASD07_15940 [Duganella sp. Root336D2]|nr:hypothetical protein ASD07_15940 [Duganella sp. Root336D2]